MKRDVCVAIVFAAALATAAVAQIGSGSGQGSGSGSGSGTGAAQHGAQAPYSEFDKRLVASLSDEDVKALLDGRGMGLALPAELNGYPGPMHVLELAEQLTLTMLQRSQMQALFERMKARAQLAGARYVEAEKAVDQAFRSGKADAAMIAQLVREADLRRADKRLAHLDAHLEAREILTVEQLAKYAELRGYRK